MSAKLSHRLLQGGPFSNRCGVAGSNNKQKEKVLDSFPCLVHFLYIYFKKYGAEVSCSSNAVGLTFQFRSGESEPEYSELGRCSDCVSTQFPVAFLRWVGQANYSVS